VTARPKATAGAALLAAIAWAALPPVALAQDVPGCGTLVNAYGPFDYTNPVDVRDKLPIVETYHFDRGVDALRGHAQSGANNLGGDLDYTLRAFPNHHRALDAMGRYQLRTKQAPPPGARFTAECYFERALTFAPGDGVAMMVYGIYLARKGDTDAALARYEEALKLMPDSSELHYNLGLLYANLGRYDEALAEAHAAYGRGFPLLGLRNKLVRAGAWRDPPPVPAADATTPADATPPAADADAGVAPDAGEGAAPDTQEQER
jgi:Flp pilus assembly protein TadD